MRLLRCKIILIQKEFLVKAQVVLVWVVFRLTKCYYPSKHFYTYLGLSWFSSPGSCLSSLFYYKHPSHQQHSFLTLKIVSIHHTIHDVSPLSHSFSNTVADFRNSSTLACIDARKLVAKALHVEIFITMWKFIGLVFADSLIQATKL